MEDKIGEITNKRDSSDSMEEWTVGALWGEGLKGGRLLEYEMFPDRVITKANEVIIGEVQVWSNLWTAKR